LVPRVRLPLTDHFATDRLMHVPNAQPPLPTDWDVQPTHPIHRVPYQLAQFWDRGVRQRVEDRTAKLQATRKKQQRQTGSATGMSVGEVPRDLREAAKRSDAVRSWVHSLEEPVRQYLRERYGPETREEEDSVSDDLGSEDEEIVFVGRDSAMRELKEKKERRWRMASREVSHRTVDSGLVFDSLGDDETAAYKSVQIHSHGVGVRIGTRMLTLLCRRWLTHAIADYYGLDSRSATLKNPTRRVVYVGLKQTRQHVAAPVPIRLPRPLWEVC
jgi:hypothetical protein